MSPRRKTKKTSPAKKTAKKRTASAQTKTSKKPKEKLIGRVAHYYDRIGVIALKLGDTLKVGDTLRIEGGTTSFLQKVQSMQIEHKPVQKAKKGDDVGIKVDQKAREGYRVYKVG